MKKEVSPDVLGSEFLHRQNSRLHTSPEVETAVYYMKANGERVSGQPAEKITAYIGFLANKDLGNDGILTGDMDSIERQVETHVVKAADVPDSIFDLRRRIYREQGRGDHTLTNKEKSQVIDEAQDHQRSSLSSWGHYLGQNDGNFPDWFKTYTWNSVTKLNNQTNAKHEFNRRSKRSMSPYPTLNGQALAYVYDYIDSSLKGDKKTDDEDLNAMIQSGNFGKLYGHAMEQIGTISPEEQKITEGSWKMFDQTDDLEPARELSASLQSYATGWCTAGLKTANNQLKDGDFYVYYTKNVDGDEVVPRIAIRMANGEVEEVRGILPEQELEPSMIDIVSAQIEDLPGGDKYHHKVEDMKRLTAIEKALDKDPEAFFEDSDVRFLFEIEHKIENFGNGSDPRIDELQRKITQDIRPAFSQEEFSKFLLTDPKRFSFFTDLGNEDFMSLYGTKLSTPDGKVINAPEAVLEHIQSFKGLNSDAALKLFKDDNPIDIYNKTHKLSMFKDLDERVLGELLTSEPGKDMTAEELGEDELEELFPELTSDEIQEVLTKLGRSLQDGSEFGDHNPYDMSADEFEKIFSRL